MFELTALPAQNTSPWETSTFLRLARLREACESGVKVVLHIYHTPDTSTFRYRCYNLMQATQGSETLRTLYFYESEIPALDAFLPNISLVVLARAGWSPRIAQFVETLHKHGIPVLFDVDDMVFDIRRLPLVTSTLDVRLDHKAAYEYWFTYVGRLELAASLADGFTTTNEFLASILREKFGKEARVIPNFLNGEQLAASRYYREQKAQKQNNNPFTLGYFSGTPSHINDFRAMYGEVVRLMAEYPDIRLLVVGYMEFPQELRPFLEDGRIVRVPLVDFLELQRLTAQVDVNLAPLHLNTFTNCKSELKFFEAAVVDTLTVASPSYTFSGCIRHGENGYLARPGEWYDVLEHVYRNFDAQRPLVEQARADALQHYAGAEILGKIEQAYTAFL